MSAVTELSVITKAKELCSYILTVTEKSPKRFRFTLVGKLQSYALTVIEALIQANEVYVMDQTQHILEEAWKERRSLQQRAITQLKLLSYMAQISMEQQCILPKQYEQITKKIYDTQDLIGAWIKSDRKRFAGRLHTSNKKRWKKRLKLYQKLSY